MVQGFRAWRGEVARGFSVIGQVGGGEGEGEGRRERWRAGGGREQVDKSGGVGRV